MAEVWGETVFSIFRTVLYMQTVLGQISSVLVVIILLCLVSTMRSMRRARDVREQIEGLMIRVEIEMTSNPIDDVAIRKVHISINVVVKIFCHLVMFFTTF
jgi:1,4-dihydroxy-2-naphthoate octaprenyltransferase